MSNIGSVDRTLRFIAGAALLVLPFLPPFSAYFAGFGAWKFAFAAVGLLMLVTAGFRFCPLYRVLGIQTCPVK